MNKLLLIEPIVIELGSVAKLNCKLYGHSQLKV